MTWRCEKCGDSRWAGWRAGPARDGFSRYAQCVRCGHVQDLPPEEVEPSPSGNPRPLSLPGWLVIPGLPEALRDVSALFELVQQGMGGIAPTVEQIVTTTMAASRPHVQAELLADLADEFAEVAPDFARMLDTISHDIREAVSTR